MFSKEILGVRVDFGMNMDDVVGVVENKLLNESGSHYICTTNPEFIVEAQKDVLFKKILNESDLSVPDGVGVIYAKDYLEKVSGLKRDVFYPIRAFLSGIILGLKGGQHTEQITGVGLTHKLCELAARRGLSVFFLEGKPKDSSGRDAKLLDKNNVILASTLVKEMYPNINIVGSSYEFSFKEDDDIKTIEYIKKCMSDKGVEHIDFLFVAYGHPNQEKWIVRNMGKIPAKISMGVGGTFDYIVGYNKLAPETYVKRNLGWLYRLITQPWRMKRVLNAFPTFPLRVFLSSLKNH